MNWFEKQPVWGVKTSILPKSTEENLKIFLKPVDCSTGFNFGG